jgi:hypothetical protein
VLWVTTVTGFVVAVGRIGVGVGGWEVSHSKVRPKSSTPLMSMSSMVSLFVVRTLIRVMGPSVFLEMILQAFTIDSEGQRVVMSSGVISSRMLRITTEKVVFFWDGLVSRVFSVDGGGYYDVGAVGGCLQRFLEVITQGRGEDEEG